MKKTKLSKKGILWMVCALMLVFGAVTVVNDSAQANVSILDYNVTYTSGDGPAETDVTLPDSEKWEFGAESYTLPKAPECKDSNFVFYKWKDTDTNTEYDAGGTFKFEKDNALNDGTALEFEAVWGVPITFDVNLADTTAGVTAPDQLVAPYKKDASLPMLSATNYEFIGWAKTADAVTADYKAGDLMPAADVTGAVKLYAVWKANFYQVIYHANTGSETDDANVTVPSDTTKYMGDNLTATIMGDGKLASTNKNYATMKDATPARTGYTFAGWATTANATTVEYKVGATVQTMDKDLNLYAVWTTGTAATATTGSGTATTSATSTTPQTGDNDNLVLYVVMAALSLLGIGYLCLDQKKAKARK